MPLTSTLIAAAPGALQAIGGGLQALFGGGRARRAERELEHLQTPTYSPSKPISDYYNTALSRYNTGAFNSPLYAMQRQNAYRTQASALNSLQDKRSALAGIGRIDALTNDNLLKAGVAADQQRNQYFSQLGNAANMKSADDKYAFNINQIMPYEKRLNLLAMKAGGGANTMNAGLNNLYGGLGNLSSIASDYIGNNNNVGGARGITYNQLGYQ